MNTNNKHIIRYASSKIQVKDLLRIISKKFKKEVVQIFDPNIILSENQLSCAYLNSISVFNRKLNISKSIAMEMLLFVAMTRKIDEAIEVAGIKNNAKFVLFCDTYSTYRRISVLIKSSGPLKVSEKERRRILENIAPLFKNETEVFGRMAVSRLYD